MKTETDQFVVDQVRWAYQQSEEIRSDRSPAEQIPTHVASAVVRCKKCSHVWRALDGDRHGLTAVLGGTRIICPQCDAKGTVTLRPR